jgi:hypothetical protein
MKAFVGIVFDFLLLANLLLLEHSEESLQTSALSQEILRCV